MTPSNQISPVSAEDGESSPQDEILFSFDAKDFMVSESAILPPQPDASDFDMVTELLTATAPYASADDSLALLDMGTAPADVSQVETSELGVVRVALLQNVAQQLPAKVELDANNVTNNAAAETVAEVMQELPPGFEHGHSRTAVIRTEQLPMQEANPSQFQGTPLSVTARGGNHPFSQISGVKMTAKKTFSQTALPARSVRGQGKPLERIATPKSQNVHPLPKKQSPFVRKKSDVGTAQETLSGAINKPSSGKGTKSRIVKNGSTRVRTKEYDFGNAESRKTLHSTPAPSNPHFTNAAGALRKAESFAIELHKSPRERLTDPNLLLTQNGPHELSISPEQTTGAAFRPCTTIKNSPGIVPVPISTSQPAPINNGGVVTAVVKLPPSSMIAASQGMQPAERVNQLGSASVSTATGVNASVKHVPHLSLSRISSSSGDSDTVNFPSPEEPETPGSFSAAGNRSQMRYSEGADPSNYCHICGRSKKSITLNTCANTRLGLCRKVVCDKCLLVYQLKWYNFAKQPESSWVCVHCQNACPPRARCHSYKRNNQKRRARKELERKDDADDNNEKGTPLTTPVKGTTNERKGKSPRAKTPKRTKGRTPKASAHRRALLEPMDASPLKRQRLDSVKFAGTQQGPIQPNSPCMSPAAEFPGEAEVLNEMQRNAANLSEKENERHRDGPLTQPSLDITNEAEVPSVQELQSVQNRNAAINSAPPSFPIDFNLTE